MPEQEVAKEKVTLVNKGRGPRIYFDAEGKQVTLGPGQELEIEVAQPMAERLKKAGQEGGSDVVVKGSEPQEEKDEDVVETPDEHKSRSALAAKEAEVMKAGQEGNKELREKWNKMNKQKLAARAGIGNMAFYGPDALATVGKPDDAPEEEPK